MITPKKRLQDILNGRKSDRPACICPGGMMNAVTEDIVKMIGSSLPGGHTDSRAMADLAKAVYDAGCFENYGLPFCMTLEAEALGAEVDLGNSRCEPRVISYAIDSLEKYHELRELDVTSGRIRVTLDAMRLLKEESKDVPIIGNITGPVSVASSVLEPTVFYKQLRKNRPLSHEYMEFVTDQLIRLGKAYLDAGADVIVIADPSGTGEILGPKMFEEYEVTYLNRLIDGIREGRSADNMKDGRSEYDIKDTRPADNVKEGRSAGNMKDGIAEYDIKDARSDDDVQIIVHICGQMHSVYDQVAKVRSQAVSFDAIVPLKEARKRLPEHRIMGNVSTYAMEFADQEKVSSLTRLSIQNGSDIVAPACGLGMGTPLANMQAVMKGLLKS